jgi:hypothetical protein
LVSAKYTALRGDWAAVGRHRSYCFAGSALIPQLFGLRRFSASAGLRAAALVPPIRPPILRSRSA